MTRLAFASAFAGAVLFAAAAAQEAAPAPQPSAPSGPSELDILSRGGAEADFPIDTVERRKPISVTLRALNKVTAKYQDLVVKIGDKASFGSLEITPRTCDKRPPEEFPETTAFIEVVDKFRRDPSNKKATLEAPKAVKPAPAAPTAETTTRPAHLPADAIFSGWMFASSPALNGLEHAVYDVWVIDCKTQRVDS